jgi:hypothetical protein
MDEHDPRQTRRRHFPNGAELLKDPFSEVTRRHRRSLVTVSSLAIVVTATGWYPTEWLVAGLTFTATDRGAFLWLLAATILYLLISFMSYVWPEQLYANAAVRTWTEAARDEPGIPWQIALPSFIVRYTIDLVTPLVIAIAALVCIFWVGLSPSTADTLGAVVTWLARILVVAALIVAVAMLVGLFGDIVYGAFRRNVRRLRELASTRRPS